ncbi:MAG: TraR/DksA C4-type zinc finger protein [Bryobacteraceae bacterium]|nr:TraR/DksA C4-type zinc finger protein [Bryobacteraceae bacterium]
MTPEQSSEFRALLETTRDELSASLEATADEAAPVSPDSSIGRLTRQDAMQAQQMALALRRRNQVRLRQIEAALERLARGEYGVCLRCEEEIALARLRVHPEAPFCVKCAEWR